MERDIQDVRDSVSVVNCVAIVFRHEIGHIDIGKIFVLSNKIKLQHCMQRESIFLLKFMIQQILYWKSSSLVHRLQESDPKARLGAFSF